MNRVMLDDEKEFDFFIEVKMVGILIWRLYKVSAKSTFSFREIMKRIFFTKKNVCLHDSVHGRFRGVTWLLTDLNPKPARSGGPARTHGMADDLDCLAPDG